MGILLLFCYNFNYFADNIFNNWILLLITKSINSFIFGGLIGYLCVKEYYNEKKKKKDGEFICDLLINGLRNGFGSKIKDNQESEAK